MLLDYQNYLFFEFATPVVQEFERVNSLFQQTRADPHELYQHIFLHQKNVQNRLYDAKKKNRKNIHKVDFDVKFLTICNKFLQQNNSAEDYLETAIVYERCVSMPEGAVGQGTCRPPSTRDNFESLSKLSPVIIFKTYVF